MDELTRQSSDRARNSENRGRLAHAYGRFVTSGPGSIEFTEPLQFECTFVELPFISTGHYLDINDWANVLDRGPRDLTSFPQATAYVIDWDLNDRGFYIGAWCGAAISYPGDIPLDVQIEIRHHFTFSGNAIKDFDPSLDA